MYKMYVVVDHSALTLPQCAVQSGHAIAEFMHEYGQLKTTQQWVVEDRTLVILRADQKTMDRLILKADVLDLRHRAFIEPDLDDLRTAIAFEPIQYRLGKKLFSSLRLL